jgi:hypothetical protein
MPELQCPTAYHFEARPSFSRLVLICSWCVDILDQGGFWQTNNCRPAACSGDSDCPQLFFFYPNISYACRRGLCQITGDGAGDLSPVLVQMLCLAKTSRFATTDPEDDPVRHAWDLAQQACLSSPDCSVPASCWQP